MSGIVGSKLNIRGSGRIAKLGTDGQVLTSAGAGQPPAFEDLAGGISWQSVTTGSTLTAVAGNGYPIDTTSNECTITLPASASVGDTIVLSDYDRTWGTNKIILDQNGLNYQGLSGSLYLKYSTDGQSVRIVYMDATNGWIPTLDEAVDIPSGNDEGIFGFGTTGSVTAVTNLVSNTGVVSSDVTGVGTARKYLAACEYAGNKGIFGFGNSGSRTNVTNLVSNAGVVASDQAATTGTARDHLAACTYGNDKGIFGGGDDTSLAGYTNLVTNAGVVGTDVTAVMTARRYLAATEYGGDKGIFGFGATTGAGIPVVDETNLVTNLGVVGTDVTGVGTDRQQLAACGYGYDKGIFGFGHSDVTRVSMTNLVSNSGVVAADVTGVGTARSALAATQYGSDKGIFSYGGSSDATNLVSNAGVVATDVTQVGTTREGPAACSFN